MNNLNTCFEEKIFMKLAIYRNVLGKKNIKDYELIGIVLELIYSNIIKIDEFLGISKKTIEYKNKNIRYLDELEKELENIYETLTGDTKKKEAFRKNLLDWVREFGLVITSEEAKKNKKTLAYIADKDKLKEIYNLLGI